MFGVINVQHDISPIGKSNCEHQIDVYYEIEGKNGINKVAIECKKFNKSKVKIGHVRNFWAAIHDLGFDKGIMVTKNQYQKGAKKYADYYGIDLMIMKEFDASNLILESEFPLFFTGFIESIDAKSVNETIKVTYEIENKEKLNDIIYSKKEIIIFDEKIGLEFRIPPGTIKAYFHKKN